MSAPDQTHTIDPSTGLIVLPDGRVQHDDTPEILAAGREAIEQGLDFTIGTLAQFTKHLKKELQTISEIRDKSNAKTAAALTLELSRVRRDLITTTNELSKLLQATQPQGKRRRTGAVSAAPGQQVGVAVQVNLSQNPTKEPSTVTVGTRIQDPR